MQKTTLDSRPCIQQVFLFGHSLQVWTCCEHLETITKKWV